MKFRGIGIEIGVAKGSFSNVILQDSQLSKFYMLDNWQGSEIKSKKRSENHYKRAKKIADRYPYRAVIMVCDSLEGVKKFPDEYFDFIYIDADHSYESVKQDIEAWYPKCKVGGIFSGHDYVLDKDVLTVGKYPVEYYREKYGVKEAVDELCEKYGIEIMLTKFKRRCPRSWYFVKP